MLYPQPRKHHITMSNEEREIFTLAAKASMNISKINIVRFNREEIAILLSMIAEGCSNKTITRRMKTRCQRDVTVQTINRYKVKYASNLTEFANSIEAVALNEGFARRAVRILSMSKLAEAMEEDILNEDGSLTENASSKMIKEYRETLKQIAQEVGDMPTDGPDVTFINMSDDDLKEFVATKLRQNGDLSVILAERAGVRPQPQAELIASDGEVISNDDGTGYKPRSSRT